MNLFPKSELIMLLEKRTEGCIYVSIYMPTVKPGSTEVQQNPIRLRNLLREAEKGLINNGMRRPEAVKLLEPAEALLDDSFFGRHQSDGLAIFITQDFSRYYRLPVPFKEMAIVADRFHVKPLIPILSGDGRFYVLALSQKEVRLLQCTHYGVKGIALTDIFPKSFAEFLRYDELDRQLMYHMHAGVASLGGEAMIAHGKEVGEETKEDLLRYFQQIGHGLRRDILREENAPLVLAAVDYLFSIYKEANNYRYLLDKAVGGNPEELSSEELKDKAFAIVGPFFEQSRKEAVKRYQELGGTNRVTKDLAKVVPESYYGKIDILFVATGQERWGVFDAATATVDVHPKAEPCDEDLLDFSAAHTLAHRGTVYVMEPKEVPGGSPVAAVLRY